MSLQQVVLEDLRKYTRKTVVFTGKTALLGENGSGKTTIIEALRIISVGKSFRTNRIDEAIRFDRPYTRIQTKWNEHTVEFFFGTQFEENPIRERVVRLDGKDISYLDYIGRFPTVLFIPDHINIILGAPSERRRYIDSVLWQVDKEFREAHLELQRILKERSALLFQIKNRRAKAQELEVWTELLQKNAIKIRSGRDKFITYLNEQLSSLEELKHASLIFSVTSQPAFTEDDTLTIQEIQSAQNLLGPHRDEIEVVLNDRSARRFASRGQARTGVAMIKIIEADFISKESGTPPVILLDDIFSELDESNAGFLLNALQGRYQIVATTLSQSELFTSWTVTKLGNDS